MPDTTRKLLALFVLSLCADLPPSITARTASRLRHLSRLSGAKRPSLPGSDDTMSTSSRHLALLGLGMGGAGLAQVGPVDIRP